MQFNYIEWQIEKALQSFHFRWVNKKFPCLEIPEISSALSVIIRAHKDVLEKVFYSFLELSCVPALHVLDDDV